MRERDFFKVIILNGRPASGKSEVIDFLKKVPPEERLERFHIAEIDEIDDFPMIWTWFEEDMILEKVLGKPRIHTDKDGYFLHEYQWHLLIERISLEYAKRLKDIPNYEQRYTALVEFSRGTEHGGYIEAYKHLSEEILRKAAIFYIDVSFEESLRKNRKRFNPDKPHSILEHSLPDEKLRRLYYEVDWDEFTKGCKDYVSIKGIKVPFVVFHNEPDITDKPDLLSSKLEELLSNLWRLYKDRRREEQE